MKFQVLAEDAGPCNQLADNLRASLKKLNPDLPVETSPCLIADLNVGSPVLAGDHGVIASGKLLGTEEITELLTGLRSSGIDHRCGRKRSTANRRRICSRGSWC